MPDLWLPVDTAVTVPANILPLIDDTDFKTIETAVAYNAAGIAVKWIFTTAAGICTIQAVTLTTASTQDWSALGGGMYVIELPTSGASVNNDTEGVGYFTGVATGVLPWRSPTIGFAPAAIINALIAGTDFLPVDAHKPNFSVSGGTLTVKKPDGTTTAYTKSVTSDPAADPITGAS